MKDQITLVTRKGQVTIPADIRKALNLKEGDSVEWMMEEGQVRLKRNDSVVARTAGMLKSEHLPISIEDERDAMEHAIAEEVIQRSSR